MTPKQAPAWGSSYSCRFVDSHFPSDNLHASTRMPLSAPQRQEHTGELLDRHFQLILGIGREPHQETSLVFARRMQRRQTQEVNAGPARSINGLALGNVADEDTGQESG